MKTYTAKFDRSKNEDVYVLLDGKILKTKIGTNGYFMVSLSKKNIQKSFMIHKLVFENFTGKVSDRKIVIDHINNIKTDNRLENLQLITNRENSYKDKKSKSGHYCIYRNSGAWLVRLRIDNVKKSLGTFKCINKAIECRDNYLKQFQ
jgi:hypothetical protein